MPRIFRPRRGYSNSKPRRRGKREARQRLVAALKPARRGSFHAEFIANAKAEEEEENGAEDGLNGGYHFEPSERSINCQTEIPAEAEDVEGVRRTEAKGFFDRERIGKYD
jgi:hypothetical protein